MLLVSMGTQPIQCDRIINAIINANINEKIVIQAYYKKSKSINFENIEFFNFISYDEMEKYIEKADIIVVSGTGAILRALIKEKKVIIFPRLGKYNEAADDHGLEMKILKELGYCEFIDDEKDFKKIYDKCKKSKYKKFVSNKDKFVNNLKKEIDKL